MIDGRAPIETFTEIDSTLLEARRRAERGEIGPVWLIAETQTAGRGRRGRTWLSPAGNLLATYLGATERKPPDVALLGFAAGLAIAEASDVVLGRQRASLKWPNDVLIDGAKIAGILIDSGPLPDGRLWVALAFGVNVAAAPENLDQPVTSLREALGPAQGALSPLAFLDLVIERLGVHAAQLEATGFEPLRAAWLARAHGLGALARVAQGDTTIEGRLAGLSARGELELDTPAGRRLIAAGDVYFSNVA